MSVNMVKCWNALLPSFVKIRLTRKQSKIVPSYLSTSSVAQRKYTPFGMETSHKKYQPMSSVVQSLYTPYGVESCSVQYQPMVCAQERYSSPPAQQKPKYSAFGVSSSSSTYKGSTVYKGGGCAAPCGGTGKNLVK